MILKLFNTSSSNNTLDKELTDVIEMEGVLREATSILNPTILINLNPDDLKAAIVQKRYVVADDKRKAIDDNSNKILYDIINEIIRSNYTYIPDFMRFYFIDDIISVGRGLWEIRMSYDVLMSFKNEIVDLEAYILRNEFKYDLKITDPLIPFRNGKEIYDYKFPKGELVNTTFKSNYGSGLVPDEKYNYVLSYIPHEEAGLTTGSYKSPIPEVLPDVSYSVVGNVSSSIPAVIEPFDAYKLSISVNKDSTLYDFVLNLIAYPFEVPCYKDSKYQLQLGEKLTNSYVYTLKEKVPQYRIVADFYYTRKGNNFIDMEPHKQFSIYLPYLGFVPLQAEPLFNHRILVVYVVDFFTGDAQVYIIDYTDKEIIYTSSCQLGIKVPLNTTNRLQMENNDKLNGIGLGLGLLASATSLGTAAASGNPLAAVGGVMKGAGAVADYVAKDMTNYQSAKGSLATATTGVYAPQEVFIRETVSKPTMDNQIIQSKLSHIKGLPLNQFYKLSEIKGFTMAEAHADNIKNATKAEKDDIESLLKQGIII